jgi:serine protease Do
MNDLPRAVAATPVDKKVKVVVLRDGKRKTLKATVAKMDDPQETQLASARGSGTTSFGLRVQNLTSDLAQRLGVDEEHGVVITAVQPGSSAAEAGLHRQDIILEVDKQEVEDVDGLEEQLAKADDGVLLLIRRGDSTLFVPLEQPPS